ncbi:pilus assembly protein TadG-related protein [Arthrobacter zhaoguopingii]|uniref:pilus assembly protein TadG-related protein n=1 Tax=Arthrobacter zhaoguopingii TaxID=2681491 RepID=UPI001358CFA1|nr:Tad domain-containing protein [Arthrobacter zhaoguopingii]
MRRLITLLKRLTGDNSQQGASTVIVAVLMVALLGFTALVVDVGAMYAEKAQLQNGADAAALAIAGDCARGDLCTIAAVTPTGEDMADGNANDDSSGVASIDLSVPGTVRVETNARDAATGADSLSLNFARIFGIETSDIGASAEASWGPPSGGSAFPWTVSKCIFMQFLSSSQRAELNATGSFTGNPSSAPVLLRYDTSPPVFPGCPPENGYLPGGFGWLDTTGVGCSAEISTSATVDGRPGNVYPTDAECNGMLATLLNEPVLIPLFDQATANGSNTVYRVIGFAAFEITAYKLSGGGPGMVSSPAPAGCTGDCRAIAGRFTRFVALDEMPVAPGLPNYGASVVSLTR